MNTGLVLSGGGMRGVAHIGVIKALEESGKYPTHISGTSAGAIVGVLYAGGIGWEEILHFFKTIPIFHTHNYALGKPGFIDSSKFYTDFKKLLPEDDFKALKMPFFVTATDIIKGSLKIFDSGEVIRPVLASASFPGVFTPTKIGESYYIDGGVINNFPVEPLKESCDEIIGSFVNPLKKIKVEDLKHSYNIADRAYKIKITYESLVKFADCDVVIFPEKLCDFGTFDVRDIDTIFQIGYSKAKSKLDSNKNNLS
ncbi:patatin-like phospholipase family protein [Maribacter polysiphoniae]|uniref:NTE family protein n=1 Tax=Maribacter polysiphoniae TaxID=429344 RepID=A0A316DJJ1_9FLAO|nr:patatin-like phospholipase family protein [Maribacter polysiphoniae]MBD1263147.1 patatin-like phospholipase family protein [Maribacter polysiphoniae]PWK18354.1 NTE family protein [Maribacter polysiphoniae]